MHLQQSISSNGVRKKNLHSAKLLNLVLKLLLEVRDSGFIIWLNDENFPGSPKPA